MVSSSSAPPTSAAARRRGYRARRRRERRALRKARARPPSRRAAAAPRADHLLTLRRPNGERPAANAGGAALAEGWTDAGGDAAPPRRNGIDATRVRRGPAGEPWFPCDLSDVAEAVRVREGAELLQALVLDLPDALARDVEGPPDLVERPWVLAVEAVAKLEHAALAQRERAEDARQRHLAHVHLGDLVRERLRVVGDEVAELRLLLVPDRLLERDRRLGAPPDLRDLVRGEAEIATDLARRRLTAELGAQLAFGAEDLVQLLDDVDGHPDRAAHVG